ncbi:cell wall elongation regulator TseB-like domain-containing protein [Calidifontibacillus oryziterrae]|uniref:cell wall elongation regulator TseB-like domain-containing protein n=1 Tax=Calidifontibacillus oryziterrae TaxID=1191699 RepID=UPI00030150E4|nr:DUF5590 domain-containing protein [Calidifontibacillus oryziterrae]
MKKWLFFISLLLIFVIWQASYIYMESIGGLKKEEQDAISYAKKHTNLIQATDVEYYHGSSAYYIVYGRSKYNEDLIVWVPASEDGELLTRLVNQGWKKEKVRSHVMESQNPLEIIDIRLGAEVMKDNRTEKTEIIPLWEVTYIDQQNRYTYYFIKFIDGSFVKRYSLKKDRF